MLSSIRSKIEYVRHANLETKKRWLIGSSAAAMIIIVLFWLAYINAVVIPSSSTARAQERSEPGILKVLGAGLGATTESLKDITKSFRNLFTQGRTFEINR